MLNLDKDRWRTHRFADIATNVKDRVDDPSQSGLDRYVGLEHLDPGSVTVNRWGDPSDVTATKLVFRPGDVIFGRRRAYQKKTAQADFHGIASAHALVLRAKPQVISERFLPHFIASDYFLDRAISISVGSLSPTVNWRDLAVQEFALPPLDEQERIADLLWAVERCRAALLPLATRIATVYESSLASLPADNRTLSEVCGAQAGGTPLRSRPDYYGGGIPWLKSGEVSNAHLGETEESISELGLASSSAKMVHMGAVLVALYGDGKTRGTVGRAGCAMATNQAVLALKPNPALCDEEFLFHWMFSRSPRLRAKSAGGAQKNLTKRLVLEEPFPSMSVPQQAQVAAQLSTVLSGRDRIQDEILSVSGLRSSLIASLLGNES